MRSAPPSLKSTIAAPSAPRGSALGNIVDQAILNFGMGDFRAAELSSRKALELSPDHPTALHVLAMSLLKMGRAEEAQSILVRVCEQAPRSAGAMLDLARAALAAKDLSNAFGALKKTVVLAANDVEVLSNFARVVEPLGFPQPDRELADKIAEVVNLPGIDAHYLHRPLIDLLSKEPEIGQLLSADVQAVAAAWEENGLASLSTRKACLTLFARLLPASGNFERLLTCVRRVIILWVGNAPDRLSTLSNERLALVAALARQSHNNEFLFAETEEERIVADDLEKRLEKRLAAKSGTDKETTALVALVGMYTPLSSLTGGSWLAKLSRRLKEPILSSLVSDYVVAPLKERAISAELPSLTPIEDATSQRVKEQYEENPYPRWFDTPTEKLVSLELLLRQNFPHLGDAPLLKKPERALIAGCGSGRQAFILARQLPDTPIVAVDLSRASLAHAVRWQEQLASSGVGQNVSFYNGDILKLDRLEERFDVIECFGVLHHMEDPVAGWKVLADLARPGAMVRIGLYSEIARSAVVKARKFIGENGYDDTPEGIKRFRQAVFKMPNEDPIRQALVNNREFYSVSSLRDLMFHRQEHRFTISQIEAILEDLGLEFIGFINLDEGLTNAFSRRFPDDPTRTDLDNWKVFEEDNPSTFLNCYDMWLKKKA